MRVLLVEDQPEKREQIRSFVFEAMAPDAEILDATSLRMALRHTVDCARFDLILLDMSMPNFDGTPQDPLGRSPESFAGKEFLEQMRLRSIVAPVIVITQYSAFEGGTVTLDSLAKEFQNQYGDFYLGAVYYNSASDAWKQHLLELWEAHDGQRY
ncbi:MAG: response regulator [Lentisphaerae bacterium]|jgi:CheY-like chemotaxis protein|nr:response regulator [Lentisphaerota bacterium]MBT4822350.1 response regulator [Lentisphaerota bacterium]MBT5612947.1 response regulator [Lentisphaerota bacterium]MBT7843144.1 response regulator [Lentisphaerota bacterium]MBT7913729.1 response regulator [Candidatus Bathyarchaeota archaeon]